MNSPRPVELFVSRSPADTHALAARLAHELGPGAVLALHGQLGAGKTCFVQGLGRALSVRGPVSSPTFTLINEYPGERPLYHIDLYRLADVEEILDLEFAEYLDGEGVTVIEWAERAAELLPPRTIHLRFEVGAEPETRRICVERPGSDECGMLPMPNADFRMPKAGPEQPHLDLGC